MRIQRTSVEQQQGQRRFESTPGAAAVAVVGAFTAVALALALPLRSQAEPLPVAAAGCERAAQPRAFDSYVPALHTYDDAIEDSGTAPDFCALEFVTNDNYAYTVGIHAHNRSGFLAGDTYSMLLDTDLNPRTGGGGVGAEYELAVDASGAQVRHWDGTQFDPASALQVPAVWAKGYGPLVRFRPQWIGDPAQFTFVMISANGAAGDRAPDTGSWSYTRRPFALRVRSLSVGPARAGKTLTARALVLRSDYDAPLDEGRIRCGARVSGRALAGRGSFTRGHVLCTWRLPKRARGKRLSGTLSVAFQGVQVRRGFTVRVR